MGTGELWGGQPSWQEQDCVLAQAALKKVPRFKWFQNPLEEPSHKKEEFSASADTEGEVSVDGWLTVAQPKPPPARGHLPGRTAWPRRALDAFGAELALLEAAVHDAHGTGHPALDVLQGGGWKPIRSL